MLLFYTSCKEKKIISKKWFNRSYKYVYEVVKNLDNLVSMVRFIKVMYYLWLILYFFFSVVYSIFGFS